MRLQTIVYVTNMARSVEWYTKLLQSDPTMRNDFWTPFLVGDATLALHYHEPDADDSTRTGGTVELSLVATEPLEEAATRMGASAIDEQPFGRSFLVTDPDGTRIQINEHHT